MTYEIRMPKLTDDMEQGTVIRWIVSTGQSVSTGDPIAEVETDKANVEIEADQAGVVSEIVVKEGSSAAVGDVIAVLGEANGESARGSAEDEDAKDEVEGKAEDRTAKETDGPAGEERKPKQKDEADGDARKVKERKDPEAAEDKAEEKTEAKTDDRAKAKEDVESKRSRTVRDVPPSSPVARELATRHDIDLADLSGSGPGGRIVKRDVEDAISRDTPRSAEAREARPKAEEATDGEWAAESKEAPVAPRSAEASEGMTRMRRTIAARMEKAKREIPHFYLRSEIDFSELMRLQEAIRGGELVAGLTVTHLLLRAIALALPRHPRLSALWVDDSVQMVDDVNIGIAVALDDGLLVPVVKRAQTLSLTQLVAVARELTERARSGKIHSDDLVGATISVSNIGMLDVDELTPIINVPQAAIIGVGAVRERPVVRGGVVAVGRTATLTLACDHRVVNGIEAGRFLEDLKHSLENPLSLVIEVER